MKFASFAAIFLPDWFGTFCLSIDFSEQFLCNYHASGLVTFVVVILGCGHTLKLEPKSHPIVPFILGQDRNLRKGLRGLFQVGE